MPTSKPGVVLDSEGVCQACRNYEKRKNVDWYARLEELRDLCNLYRGMNGTYYDCIIAASSGKDSHFQTYMMKNVMKMNPLLVSIDNTSWTQTGRKNQQNISDAFGCDVLTLTLNRNLTRKMMRKAFEKDGIPAWSWDRAVYTYPLRIAIQLGIPLIVYGENTAYEYGGLNAKETPSALEQIYNGVDKGLNPKDWLGDGITMKDMNPYVYPKKSEIKKAKLNPIYLSYFVPWSGRNNLELAKKFGFKDLDDTKEWTREGYPEQYDQIDDDAYLVHPWLKYPKFGFALTTDRCCYWIREGRMTREEAVKLVNEHDHKLDKRALKAFLDSTGYSEEEFWNIVEKFWNQEIFEKVDGKWKLKKQIE